MPTVTGYATDYITFSRASNATVTDSNGYIKWAAHNLLTNSESFDAAAWTKTAATISANTIAAPNGTTTADTVSENTANDVHSVSQSFTASAIYTYSVYLKYNNLQYVTLSLNNNSVSTEWASAIFDVQNGIVASQNAATITIVGTPTITAVGGGWYLCTISANLSAVATGQAYLAAANTSTGATFRGAQTYTGSSRSFYAWGAHLYRSDLGGMVANTSAYPYYNPTTPKNLLGYTEAFDNAAWSKTASTVTANTIVAPNGLQTGDTYTADGTSSPHRMEQIASSGYQKFFSFYAKAGTNNFVQVFFGGDAAPWANFNLSTGAVGSTGSNQTAAIADAGNGWYRCSVYTSSSTATNVAIAIVSSASAARNETNTLTTSIYLWGAQLSDSASLDPYVPVYGAAVTSAAYYGPRLDYDGSTLAANGLLVEEQRTNLLTYSEQFDDAAWFKSNTTVTANSTTSPDGLSTADKITENTALNTYHAIYKTSPVYGVTGAVTFSLFAKAAGRRYISLDINDYANGLVFDLQTGTITGTSTTFSGVISPAGNGFYRCSISKTYASPTDLYPEAIISTASTAPNAYTGDGTSGLYIYGAQLEAGSFATSYIPTTSATVTRSADVASVSTQAFPYNSSEGSIVAAYSVIGYTSSDIIASLNDNTSSNIIELHLTSATGVNLRVRNAGVNQVQISTTINSTGFNKSGGVYKLNDFVATSNGATVGTDTAGTVPTVDRLGIGSRASASFLNGHIRQITYLPRRISNAELQSRTT